MNRKVIVENFWPPHLCPNDPTLYEDELGWQKCDYANVEHATESRELFKFFCEQWGFDLMIYFADNGEFYYCDVHHNRCVLHLHQSKNWDGKYLFQKCEFTFSPHNEFEEIFDFDDVWELWNDFRLDGHNLEYVIDHSVVFKAP